MTTEMLDYVMSMFSMVAFQVCGPLLFTAMAVGVVIGMLQAVTQIQEMTLTFVPKMIAMGMLIAALGWWMLDLMVGFTRRVFELIPVVSGG